MRLQNPNVMTVGVEKYGLSILSILRLSMFSTCKKYMNIIYVLCVPLITQQLAAGPA
jgi:hypothetical protein